MKSLWKPLLACSTAAFCLSVSAAAEEWATGSPRALGMGGAGVAVVDEMTASHLNPAAVSKEGRMNIQIYLGSTVGAEGGVLAEADALANQLKTLNLGTDLDTLADPAAAAGAKTTALTNVLSILDEISGLSEDGQGVLAQASVGLLIQINNVNNFGLSAMVTGYAAVDPFVNASAASWGLIDGGVDADERFETILGVVPGTLAGYIAPNAPPVNTAVRDNVTTVLTASGVASPQEVANRLVWIAEQATSVADVAGSVGDLVEDIAQGTSAAADGGATGSSFENNSGAVIRALQLYEYGISFARSLMEGRVAVGIRLKGLHAETRYIQYTVQDGDADPTNDLESISGGDLVDDLQEDNNSKKTTAFDADLGLLYMLKENVLVGLVARHVLSPEFDFAPAADIDAVKMEPQVRLGVAYRPASAVTLAADIDLTVNESEILQGYESQQVCLGVEWRPVGFFALRGGGYNNMASDETDWVYTGGFGFHWAKFAFDISGAMSGDEQSIEAGAGGEKIAERYGLAAAFTFNTVF